jgi:hypothetical protein
MTAGTEFVSVPHQGCANQRVDITRLAVNDSGLQLQLLQQATAYRQPALRLGFFPDFSKIR